LYLLVIVRSAERELKRIAPDTARRIGEQIALLATDPHPQQSRRLQNTDRFRLRVGDYRVIYSVDDTSQTVTILAVGHRRDIYRRL
jgi:mRNA interferase RelE/StbE